MKKKILSILLIACMLCALLPFGVNAGTPAAGSASYGAVIGYGNCGEGLTWYMYNSGTLLISGHGNMYDYTEDCMVDNPNGGVNIVNVAPWSDYIGIISSVIIEDGTGNIGKVAFANCTALSSVLLPDSVRFIGAYAFYNCPLLDGVDIPSGVTAIQYSAFQSCSGLLEVYIPKTVSSIGDAAFDAPESIDDVYYGHTSDEYSALEMGSGNERITSGTVHFDVAAVEGHYSADSVTAPTCTEKGYTTYKCPCGYSYKDNFVDATGHTYIYSVTQDPTATAAGTLTGQCKDCISTVSVTLPMLDKTAYSYAVVEQASCTATGTATYTWKDTSYGSVVISVTLPKTSHSYTASVTAPTCTEKGYTTHTCACGDSYVDTYVDALGHDWDDGQVTVPATEESTGLMTYTCTRCPATRSETIPVLSHTHRYTASVTASTCTEKGYTTHTCTCGDSYVDTYVDALGHSYGDWYQTKAPGCTEKGTERHDCTRCTHYETRDIAALGHNFVSGKCTRCHLVLDPKLDIKNPSTTTIKYGETLVLTANVSDMPDGASVKWSISGSGASLSSSGTTAYVKCTGSGSVTVTATMVDSSGNPVSGASDSVSVTMKSNIILKIISWIKDLFNINRNVYSLVDDGVYVY